ncbi:MAG: hypothetical protein QM784_39790 [Polyangiaceae bacterium]
MAYLRCFFVNGCTPLTSCYTNVDGLCGQNKYGLGATGRGLVETTWSASKCTSATAPMP